MPITMVRQGEALHIKRIAGNTQVRRHLENLGFIQGERVTVISEAAGNLIVGIKDSRIALSQGLASKIFV